MFAAVIKNCLAGDVGIFNEEFYGFRYMRDFALRF